MKVRKLGMIIHFVHRLSSTFWSCLNSTNSKGTRTWSPREKIQIQEICQCNRLNRCLPCQGGGIEVQCTTWMTTHDNSQKNKIWLHCRSQIKSRSQIKGMASSGKIGKDSQSGKLPKSLSHCWRSCWRTTVGAIADHVVNNTRTELGFDTLSCHEWIWIQTAVLGCSQIVFNWWFNMLCFDLPAVANWFWCRPRLYWRNPGSRSIFIPISVDEPDTKTWRVPFLV